MAVTDNSDSFTDVINNAVISLEEEVQRMVDFYKQAFQQGTTKINDFNEGSEIRNLLTAVGISAFQLRFIINELVQNGNPFDAVGIFLDYLGVFVGVYRILATSSTGYVSFTLNTPLAYDMDFPEGTEIDTDPNKTGSTIGFVTTEDVTITAGSTAVIAPIQAIIPGKDGDVVANTITVLAYPIDGVSVTNPAETDGGNDEEDDISLQNRIIEAGKGGTMGSIGWYQSESINVIGVHDAEAISNPNDANSTVQIFVNGKDKPTSQDVLNAVSAYFQQDTCNVGGIKLVVTAPSYSVVNIGGTVVLMDGYTWSNVIAAIAANLACYFNGGTTSYGVSYPGLSMKETVIKSTIELIIKNTDGVLDYALTSPAENINTGSGVAAMLGSVNLTQG